jgi:hypothetical protein
LPAAVYLRSSATEFVATELAAGPWDPGAQHGGPPSALLAHCVASVAGDDGLVPARMTFELLKPVPLGELTVAVTESRGGKRVRLFEASLAADGVVVMRARMLRVRGAGSEVPVVDDAPGMAPVPAADARWVWRARESTIFAPDAIEVRFVSGRVDQPGPAAAWFRMRVPMIEGVELTPLQSLAAAADFGNGIASVLDWAGYTFINPDLTVYLEREPLGSWIGLDSQTRIPAGGIGVAESVLYDERGRVGRAIQSLFVAGRAAT